MSTTHDSSQAQLWQPAPQHPRLGDDQIHVWRAALTRTPAEVELLRELLSGDELERAERFRFPHDRSSFIVARGTLREILSRYVRLPPAQLCFDYNDFGKPELRAAPVEQMLRFNLSHAGDVALYAVAAREVGVDVEVLREGVACEEIASHFFSRREVSALMALPAEARRRAFFECWTRKEAYIKARGRGLSLPLDAFDVSLAPSEPAALLSTSGDALETAQWSLQALSPGVGYVAAVAAKGHGWRLCCWQWPPSAAARSLPCPL